MQVAEFGNYLKTATNPRRPRSPRTSRKSKKDKEPNDIKKSKKSKGNRGNQETEGNRENPGRARKETKSQKLIPEESERYMKEGLFVCYRKPGHIAKNCLKDRRPEPVLISIDNIQSEKLQKLTSKEREHLMQEGLCVHCRKPGHIAKVAQKAFRTDYLRYH